MKEIATYFVLSLSIILIASEYTTAQDESASAAPVTINFDNLAPGTIVTNQYPDAVFSGMGFSGGVGTGPNDTNVFVSNGRYRSYPNSIISTTNSYPSFGWVYVDFPIAVNNLSFYALNIYDSYYAVGYVDIYQNRNYYGTLYFTGNGNPNSPIPINLSAIPNITGIYIYQYASYDRLYYDDFTFTPNLNVNITSGRVSGILNGTTQNALLGADVTLNASIDPSSLIGGTYSWSVTGPNQQVSATNTSSSYTVRWTETGTYQATVNYTRNGVHVSATVNVNVVVPTLSDYHAVREENLMGRGGFCGQGDYLWSLGCAVLPGGEGMNFFATANIPAAQYLSDPAQSGIKFVQAVSAMRKIRFQSGNVNCLTGRTSEDDATNSWRVDNSLG
ncbi:MAG TPA: hypothetical protein VKB86_22090, partial [Pyrinomonadaceae bacterium]|nr:hypothetical protein [Pyrinomonadaceae bacterium]